MEYYWVADQAEYSTDVLFKDAAALAPLFGELLRQATLCFGAEDVMHFLGRKMTPQFQGELRTSSRRREPGTRIKHWMKENWIKMYNKAGLVLRIETVINNPYEFRVRRMGKCKGEEVMGWFPMSKGVKNLGRYREVMLAANGRYLEALAALQHPAAAHRQLERVCEPVRYKKRSRRGINPLRQDDLALLKAAMRGEHCLNGLRNRDLAAALGLSKPQDQAQARRQSARVTARGATIMGAAIHYRERALPEEIMALAA